MVTLKKNIANRELVKTQAGAVRSTLFIILWLFIVFTYFVFLDGWRFTGETLGAWIVLIGAGFVGAPLTRRDWVCSKCRTRLNHEWVRKCSKCGAEFEKRSLWDSLKGKGVIR